MHYIVIAKSGTVHPFRQKKHATELRDHLTAQPPHDSPRVALAVRDAAARASEVPGWRVVNWIVELEPTLARRAR